MAKIGESLDETASCRAFEPPPTDARCSILRGCTFDGLLMRGATNSPLLALVQAVQPLSGAAKLAHPEKRRSTSSWRTRSDEGGDQTLGDHQGLGFRPANASENFERHQVELASAGYGQVGPQSTHDGGRCG